MCSDLRLWSWDRDAWLRVLCLLYQQSSFLSAREEPCAGILSIPLLWDIRQNTWSLRFGSDKQKIGVLLLCKLEGTEILANHSRSNQICSQRSGLQVEICLDSSILSSQTKKPCLCFCCSGVLVDTNEAQANPWQWHLWFRVSYSQQAELYRFPQRMKVCQINTNINVQA